MVPWPIAVLTLLYGLVAVASAASLWRIFAGMSHQMVIGPAVWLTLSATAVCGLPFAKPWGRTAAISVSVLLALLTLGIAGMLVANGRILFGLLSALLAGTHFLIIRYLQRPAVKAYFGYASAVSTQ